MTQNPLPKSVCERCKEPPCKGIHFDIHANECERGKCILCHGSCQPKQEGTGVTITKEDMEAGIFDMNEVEKNIDKILGDCVCSVDGCKNVILHPSIASVCDEHAMKTQRKCCEEARADERKKVIQEAYEFSKQYIEKALDEFRKSKDL